MQEKLDGKGPNCILCSATMQNFAISYQSGDVDQFPGSWKIQNVGEHLRSSPGLGIVGDVVETKEGQPMAREQIELDHTNLSKEQVRKLAEEYFQDKYEINDPWLMSATDFFVQDGNRAVAVLTKETWGGKTLIHFMDTCVSFWARLFSRNPAPDMRQEFRKFVEETPAFHASED